MAGMFPFGGYTGLVLYQELLALKLPSGNAQVESCTDKSKRSWGCVGDIEGESHRKPFNVMGNFSASNRISISSRAFNFGAPVHQFYPLTKVSFLQSSTVPHGFRGAFHLSRLIGNSEAREGSDDDKPPFGPLEGCIPLRRAGLGCICICAGFVAVLLGDGVKSVTCGFLLVLGGTVVWLGQKIVWN